MAKVKAQTANKYKSRPKVSRPGIHAKTKTSYSKVSRNYKKLYKGQGR
jgi:hypothetical protein